MIKSRMILMGSALLLGLGAVACNGGSQPQDTATSSPEPTSAPTEDVVPAPDTTPVPQAASAPPEEPNQDNLAMTCTGSITVNDIDFTVDFTREAGFSRVELKRPATGEVFAESFLSYDGTNAAGEDIWRGSVQGMADVTLVHLSPNPAQIGDQVSVGYDMQWGRGNCR
ncbi:hypothetical protein GFS31_18360 [Leptolyngbya sp. BL0902]|uniref:hypothetical protein n=1 Tax=Leptolyngbya sp. BL0902 TaxID=1115757 RepID=UPI0018E826FE|nr:hypothetical protein [Leptolyngbya sp. BL0902]QQE65151.1 hypothetical protein GFS31_18360 [Leptolyngbya sp. BL0902]